VSRKRQVRELLLCLDRGRGGSIGRQIEVQLREKITSGLLPMGTSLPSTRVLAEDVAVSRGVIARAYQQLAAEGYIALRQGVSPRVKGSPARLNVPPKQQNGSAQVHNGSGEKYRFDLRPNLPDLNSFPRAGWLRAQRSALQSATTLEVASIDGPGLWTLREELAAYLGRSRGVLVRPESIVVTAGNSQSLSLIVRALAVEGVSDIAFENPSCTRHHAAVREAGSEPRGVRIDEQGLVVSDLDDAGIGAVVVSSTLQFPTGTRLSETRRVALIEWATESGGLIIESDSELREGNAHASLQRQAPSRVIYLGSTGKTLGPFARLGWAVVPDQLMPRVQELSASLLHVSSLDQLAFGEFLARGDYDRHIVKMRTVYRERRAVLMDALRGAFPDSSIVGPVAGLHVVLQTERDGLASTVCSVARKRGLALDPISVHTLPGYAGREAILVGFGQVSKAAIPAAVNELRRAFAMALPSA
jgi:GntR family transcriptional regulator / MocR family aminotransferase